MARLQKNVGHSFGMLKIGIVKSSAAAEEFGTWDTQQLPPPNFNTIKMMEEAS